MQFIAGLIWTPTCFNRELSGPWPFQEFEIKIPFKGQSTQGPVPQRDSSFKGQAAENISFCSFLNNTKIYITESLNNLYLIMNIQ